MRLLLAPLILALALPAEAAAEGAQTRTQARSSAADIEAIRAAGKKWAELYDAGRFREIPDLYTVDTVVMPRGRPMIVGREAMRKAIGGLAAGRKVDIVVTEREIRSIGDYGWYLGDFRVTYTPPQPGAQPTSENGRSLILYRRDADGQWRVHRDIDSPAPKLIAAADPAPNGPARLMARTGTFEAPALWDPKTRTEATECDRLTASNYDRTKLAPGVARAAIDVPRAIAVCEADLARLPGDPRLLFQLGRLYGYAGDKAKTLEARRAAAAAGNSNAIFLLGYLDHGAAKDDAARCEAARRMRLAAERGNYSGQVTYASYLLEGKLDACPDRAGLTQAASWLAAAKPLAEGFFETRLIDHLTAEVARRSGAQARARLMTQMAGTWRGTFRRYDANSALTETVPSEVRIRFGEDGKDYVQTNITRGPDGRESRIETEGRWDGDRLVFGNPRVTGWFGPLEGDTSGLSSVLQMRIAGDRPIEMSELLTVSPDGQRRMRVAQYVADGRLLRRTLIDETRVAASMTR